MQIPMITTNANFNGNIIFVKGKNKERMIMSDFFNKFAKVELNKIKQDIASKDYNLYIKSNGDNYNTFNICAAKSFREATNMKNDITVERKFLPNILYFTRKAMTNFEEKSRYFI